MTEEQIGHWRKYLVPKLGSYAMFMPVYQIENIVSKMPERIAREQANITANILNHNSNVKHKN